MQTEPFGFPFLMQIGLSDHPFLDLRNFRRHVPSSYSAAALKFHFFARSWKMAPIDDDDDDKPSVIWKLRFFSSSM